MATFRVAKGLKSALANATITEGTFRICTDTKELFIDVDANTRIQISSFISVDDEEALESVTSPITSKLYYVKSTNMLYHYDTDNLKWYAIGHNVYATIDNSGAVESASKLSNKRTFTITGAGAGQAEFDGSQDCKIELELADSGATAGKYGTYTDVTLEYGKAYKIPYLEVTAKGIVKVIGEATFTMPSSPLNTEYDAGEGLVLTKDGTKNIFKHKDVLSMSGETGGTSKELNALDSFTVPKFSYNKSGHLTKVSQVTYRMPSENGDAGFNFKIADYKAAEIITAKDLIVLDPATKLWYKASNISAMIKYDSGAVFGIAFENAAADAVVKAIVFGTYKFNLPGFRANGLIVGQSLYLQCTNKKHILVSKAALASNTQLIPTEYYIRLGKLLDENTIFLDGLNSDAGMTSDGQQAHVGATYLGNDWITEE